ncbi:ABC transporter permease [Demequina sp. NBRC 110056]|uniref:ABC transporter permease n=1 Tax=Demequina sp. NBRC 110056 TaxID=1570345 RepID=UPI000A03BF63|nr:ABC transporter permease [Demequina sp. NBRC 110056]
MTWTLLREQIRSQRAYAIWATLLIAAAVALASYAWTVDRTLEAQERAYAVASGDVREVSAQAALYPPDGGPAPDIDEYGVPMTVAELEDLIATANAEGAGAVAALQGAEVTVSSDSAGPWGEVAAVQWGDVRWDDAVADGRAPGPGDVMLEASTAEALGVGLGDVVAVAPSGPPGTASGAVESRTLSGLAYDGAMWPADAWPVGRAYLPTEDASAAVAAVDAALVDSDGTRHAYATVTVSWDTTTPALAQTFTEMWSSGGALSTPPNVVAPMWLAIALAVGLVAMAFAVGRAQAASRVQWTATAQALGATRGRIAVATVAEGVVIGVAGAALGLASGLGVAAAQYAAHRHSLAAALPVPLTTSPTLYWLALGGGVALGLVTAAMPAVLASRVSPSAALKDLPSVDEATLSRRAPLLPVALLFAALYIAFLIAAANASQEEAPWSLLLCAGALVTFVPVLVETARRLAAVLGRLVGRSHHPALLHAGAVIAAHPRQAAILTTLPALTVTTLVGVSAVTFITFGSASYSPWPVAAAALVATQALCAAGWTATRRLTADEDATASALGLDAQRLGLSDAVRYGAPQVLGTALGALAGVIIMVPAATAMAMGWSPIYGGATPAFPSPLWALVSNLTAITAVANVAFIAVCAAGAGLTRRARSSRAQALSRP